MAIRIGIVDDKQINRTTVKEKLARYKELEIILEAKNGDDFLEQIHQLHILPQLVLMDLEMPVLDGIETIRRDSAAYPDIKFIVLTIFEDNNKIFDAIKAGAHGYLLKDDTAVNIIDAITNVIEYNGIPMSPIIAQKAMELLRQSSISPDALPSVANPEEPMLTERELAILKELSNGKNYKAIGDVLDISPLTVRKHMSNIYTKLHVSNRVQAINIAQKKNWL